MCLKGIWCCSFHSCEHLFLGVFFFLSGFFFHKHSQITGEGGGHFLTPYYHFHLLHRHLDIRWAITGESCTELRAGLKLGTFVSECKFLMVNTWRAPVQKRLEGSTIKFAHTFLTDCCSRLPAFFLIMSYSLFIAITRRALKAYFAWKQFKVDFSKNIRKEENHGHGFVCLLVGYISVRKNYWKLQFCWCRSSE